MSNKILLPDYKGIWICVDRLDNVELGLFSMFKEGDNCGRILEKDRERLVRADFDGLRETGHQIEFSKRYGKPTADMLRGDITYFGRGNSKGFYDGEWKGKSVNGEEESGDFYLASTKEKWALEELAKIVGQLQFGQLDKAIRDFRKNEHEQFPFFR